MGVPLSPTIFNVVVGAVVRHWFDVMVESADKQSGRGQEGRHQNALFYVDGGMVAVLDPRWLQGAFSTLVGLVDRVGLNTNVGKAVGIFCRPTASITYHDFLHGFRECCGIGATTLEAKLIQKLAALREEVLYLILMDLHKYYDALDRSR